MEFLICSHALAEANMANVLAKTVFPAAARPAAKDIILPSAIPISRNLSGTAFLNVIVLVAFARSASKTIIFSLSLPYCTNASP